MPETQDTETSTEPSTETNDGPSRARRPRPWLLVGLAALMASALTAPLTAYAVGAGFADVGPGHPFYDEIEWMEDTGISTGYADGTYRPSDPVTRQAMAAFMQRLSDLQEDMDYAQSTTGVATVSETFEDVPLSTVTVTIPEGTYGIIDARFSASSRCAGGAGTCAVRLMIQHNGGSFLPMTPSAGLADTFDSGTGSDNYESHGIERTRDAAPGTYTIKAQFAVQDGATGLGLDEMMLIAETDLHPSDFIPT